jgi:hypothetical protein
MRAQCCADTQGMAWILIAAAGFAVGAGAVWVVWIQWLIAPLGEDLAAKG